jgi:hypothetical protein
MRNKHQTEDSYTERMRVATALFENRFPRIHSQIIFLALRYEVKGFSQLDLGVRRGVPKWEGGVENYAMCI